MKNTKAAKRQDIDTEAIRRLTAAMAETILQALHHQAEHQRTSYAHKGRRAMLQQLAVQAFQSAYNTSTALKNLLPEPLPPKNLPCRIAAAIRRALSEYQGAYWAWKDEPNADNLSTLETARNSMRRMALSIKNNFFNIKIKN